MKRQPYSVIVFFVFLITTFSICAQELVVIPGGVLQPDDSAEVTGDYVRVRTGPTLEHRILTKVNHGTPVTVLERDDKLVTIKEMKNYWYRIRLDKSGIEGWMFGHYLKKREKVVKIEKETVPTIEEPIPFKKVVSMGASLPYMDNLGSIEEPHSLVTSGDLNDNGVPEIIFLGGEERIRNLSLVGYEPKGGTNEKKSYSEAYRIEVRGADVRSIEVFSGKWLEYPLIVTNGKTFSHVYTFDEKRNSLRFMFKTDSPLISMGSLDGKQKHIIYLKRNRVPDNDGTITYYVHAASFTLDRGRLSIQDRISYSHPLPVKKLVTYDLTGDSRAEIVCEIGGKESGGGIVILELGEEGLQRSVNTGIVTYRDNQFIRMWGTTVQDKPCLVLYTTDPENGNDAGTSFGFLLAKLRGTDLLVDQFYPVNKLLDDANNYREAMIVGNDDELPFLVMDYDENRSRYELKRPVYQ